MMSQPEKIFREKLENYQRSAPPTAWDRVEQNLNAKSNKLLWIKIAAGVLVLVIAGYLFWTNQLVQHSTSVAIIQDPVQKREEINNPELVDTVNELKTLQETIIETTPTRKDSPKKTIPQFVETNTPLAIETILTASEDLVASNQTETRKVETEVIESSVEHKSTVITYTTDEVNARFLRKKPEPVVQQETSTGIQKIADMAISIKNNDKGIGDLRQIKDEILTLDFLASNDKRQKK